MRGRVDLPVILHLFYSKPWLTSSYLSNGCVDQVPVSLVSALIMLWLSLCGALTTAPHRDLSFSEDLSWIATVFAEISRTMTATRNSEARTRETACTSKDGEILAGCQRARLQPQYW